LEEIVIVTVTLVVIVVATMVTEVVNTTMVGMTASAVTSIKHNSSKCFQTL